MPYKNQLKLEILQNSTAKVYNLSKKKYLYIKKTINEL